MAFAIEKASCILAIQFVAAVRTVLLTVAQPFHANAMHISAFELIVRAAGTIHLVLTMRTLGRAIATSRAIDTNAWV